VEKFLPHLPAAIAPRSHGGMGLGDGARLPRAHDLIDALPLEQSHGIGDYLRPLVERLISAAERIRRRHVYAADRSRLYRAENQLALWNSGTGVSFRGV